MLRREQGDRVEFTVITLWDSFDAIRRFAGDDADVAVVPAGAQALLASWDARALHWDVVLQAAENAVLPQPLARPRGRLGIIFLLPAVRPGCNVSSTPAGSFSLQALGGSTGGRTVKRALGLTLAALLCLFSVASPARAQYFGRNKVQVDSFAFRVLPTAHFDIYYYPAEQEAARLAARMAERWYGRLSKALQHTLVARPPIVLYASHAQFTQTTVIPDLLPEGVGGFTDHDRGRVVMPFAAGLGETDHVLGHELVHAFQRDILKGTGRSMMLLPLWFSEGMAEYLSVGRLDTNTRMWLRDAVHHDRLPTLNSSTIRNGSPIATVRRCGFI